MNHQRPVEQRLGGPVHRRGNTPSPERFALEELLASVESYLAPTAMDRVGLTKARLILAMNSARNALGVK